MNRSVNRSLLGNASVNSVYVRPMTFLAHAYMRKFSCLGGASLEIRHGSLPPQSTPSNSIPCDAIVNSMIVV